MSQETYNTITSKTTLIEFVLYHEQFALLSELQEVFPDIVLTCVTDQGNAYRATFYVGRREIAQRRFLCEHAIKYVERERERENIITAFFRGVELEGNPIVTLTVRRVVDQPDYHSVRLTTHDDEMLLRFPSTWTFGQKSLLPVAAPLDDKQELQQEIARLLSYINEGELTLREAANIVEDAHLLRLRRPLA